MGVDDTAMTDQIPVFGHGAARAKPAQPGVVLVSVGGKPHFRAIPLTARAIVLGRSREADVQVDDSALSGRHAELSYDGRAWRVRDLGSRNGTFLDERRIDEVGFSEPQVVVFGYTIALAVPDVHALGDGPQQLDGGWIAGAAMRRALDVVATAARHRATVLIEGESGTGKEHAAAHYRAHGRSPKGPFVTVDVGSVQGTLAEAEYRGAVKGAHSMANEDRRGFWQQANGGTIFFDELANMPMDVQHLNLRILQEREVRPIGAPRAIPIEVDVVAATNKDLRAQIAAGRFMFDLYQRFGGHSVKLPPLRDRREEIPWLIERFAKGRRASRELIARALRYAWPGNVRELELAVGRAVADEATPELSPDYVPSTRATPELPPIVQALSEPPPLPAAAPSLEDAERDAIVRALKECSLNLSKAAARLGIDRGTLRSKIKKYGLQV